MLPTNNYTSGMIRHIIFVALICLFNHTQIAAQNDTIRPKNVIIFIGDGMGLSQISSNILSSKRKTAFESFKHIGLVKTHSHSNLITDSGAAATAMATGHKTYNNAIGLNKDSIPVTNLMELAYKNNYNTGILVTSPITHATPAAFYAHSKHRINAEEIALQLCQKNIDLLIGGGRESFFDRESDEMNLIDSLKRKGYLVFDITEERLPDLNTISSKEKMIYFSSDFLPAGAISGREYLPFYCSSAPQFLRKKDKDGFFLMIEGSQLDMSLHSNSSIEFVEEMKDTEESIERLLKFVKQDKETLLIVTADHETGGLAIEGGKVGRKLKFDYTSNGHTASMVPLFAIGPGSEVFTGIYDNTIIFKKIVELLNWEQ